MSDGNGGAPETPCPICRAGSARVFRAHGHWVRACTTCGHRYAEIEATDDHVQRVYGDAYFHGGGAGYADYLGEARLLRAHGRRYARRLARFMKPGRVLDVGAAAGFVLEGLLERGWTGAAIEPNPSMAALATERLAVPVHRGTLLDDPSQETFDLLLLVQVMGHFTNPRAELQAASRRTRAGGYWLIETWDRESWAARALGRHWHEYNPPSVVQWFSPRGLDALAAGFGFVPVARGRPLKFLDGAHARSLLDHQLRASALGSLLRPALVTIPGRLTIPYFLGDAFWTLFQHRT